MNLGFHDSHCGKVSLSINVWRLERLNTLTSFKKGREAKDKDDGHWGPKKIIHHLSRVCLHPRLSWFIQRKDLLTLSTPGPFFYGQDHHNGLICGGMGHPRCGVCLSSARHATCTTDWESNAYTGGFDLCRKSWHMDTEAASYKVCWEGRVEARRDRQQWKRWRWSGAPQPPSPLTLTVFSRLFWCTFRASKILSSTHFKTYI